MYQKLADIFHPVSQQLVEEGSKIEEKHRKCFLLACAMIDALARRVPDWLDLLDGVKVDVMVPEKEPFSLIAGKENYYAFLKKVREEILSAEGFGAKDLADADFANCLNAFLNGALDALRARRNMAMA